MSICPRCKAEFGCGMREGHADAPCWCAALPPLATVPAPSASASNIEASCYCPHCLNELLAATRISQA